MSRGRKRKGFKAARVGYFSDLAARALASTPRDEFGSVDLAEFQRRLRELGEGFPHAEIARFADVCRECGTPGHWARNCPDAVCGLCRETGHIKRDCPQATT
jgi:hypothetical protein